MKSDSFIMALQWKRNGNTGKISGKNKKKIKIYIIFKKYGKIREFPTNLKEYISETYGK